MSLQYTILTNEATVNLWEVFIPSSILDPPLPVTANVTANRDYVSVVLNEGVVAFWRLPADDFSGNLLGVYDQTVTFDLSYFLEASGSSADAVPTEATMSIQVLISFGRCTFHRHCPKDFC